MKRHSFSSISTGVRAAAFVASTLDGVGAGARAGRVRPDTPTTPSRSSGRCRRFEENFPTDEAQPQAAAAPDSWSEERILPAALDAEADDAPLMLAQFDPLETP